MKHTLFDIPPEADGRVLFEYLREQGIILQSDCGGRGTCGKCKVRVIKGRFGAAAAPSEPAIADKDGMILSCESVCTGEPAVIEIPYGDRGEHEIAVRRATEQPETGASVRIGVAVDLGTTTIAAALVDITSGKTIGTCTKLNPQRTFGADVMSRISASREHLDELQSLALGVVREITEKLCADFAVSAPELITVAGNPTMLHLFCGVSPEGIGAYPFTPAFTHTRKMKGSELKLPAENIVVLPSASAFIGSDITAGAMLLNFDECDGPCLLLDMGTNCEMILKCNGEGLYTASAAAGPAMEGAGITCGVGGVRGAICRVRPEDAAGGISFDTVNDAPPVGICGSGLVDLITALLRTGKIDPTGYLEEEPFILCNGGDGKDIILTQGDVRAFQLSKSAIRAGIEALTAAGGIKVSDLKKIYIAGGLGYYIDKRNAAYVGMLPDSAIDITEAVGNSSLDGAISCLIDPECIKKAEQIADRCENVELNCSEVFNNGFIEHMMF